MRARVVILGQGEEVPVLPEQPQQVVLLQTAVSVLRMPFSERITSGPVEAVDRVGVQTGAQGVQEAGAALHPVPGRVEAVLMPVRLAAEERQIHRQTRPVETAVQTLAAAAAGVRITTSRTRAGTADQVPGVAEQASLHVPGEAARTAEHHRVVQGQLVLLRPFLSRK